MKFTALGLLGVGGQNRAQEPFKGTLTRVGSACKNPASIGADIGTDLSWILFRYKSAPIGADFSAWILYCQPAAHSASELYERTQRRMVLNGGQYVV